MPFRKSSQRGRVAHQWSPWPEYVPVAERRRQAEKEVAKLRKKGRELFPVVLEARARKIAHTFWGAAWCTNLESYSDYASRLPRGRTYARNGCIVHLMVSEGKAEALVRGSEMYEVTITIRPLTKPRWRSVVDECSGQVTSLVELLQGKLSHGVMEIVTRKDRGLFPAPREITLDCSCPDFATMCKHVAAVMYGVGARLDEQPDLLFRLRGVDPKELLSKAAVVRASKASTTKARTLDAGSLGAIFDIDIDEGKPAAPPPRTSRRPKR